ncbi:MAG: hypothetical protein MKZ95_12175, partial [Pirellulales bacterium]|nr:hypothetical protein [Pirellulales bacterium]
MAAASGTSGTSVQWYSGTVVKGIGITLVPFLVGFLSPNPPSTHLRLPPGLDTRERLGVDSSYYRVGFTPAGKPDVGT